MDEADKAQEVIETDLEENIRAARGDIPPGVEGECDELSGRLVGGWCARCREGER